MLGVGFAECHLCHIQALYAECHFAKWHYAERRLAECRGTINIVAIREF
jgi:hypothetical protein